MIQVGVAVHHHPSLDPRRPPSHAGRIDTPRRRYKGTLRICVLTCGLGFGGGSWADEVEESYGTFFCGSPVASWTIANLLIVPGK